jgi:hypothetical protein
MCLNEKKTRSQNDRVFYLQAEKERRCAMKFLMIVLVVHFVAEVIGNKRKEVNEGKADEKDEKILHPAEFNMR